MKLHRVLAAPAVPYAAQNFRGGMVRSDSQNSAEFREVFLTDFKVYISSQNDNENIREILARRNRQRSVPKIYLAVENCFGHKPDLASTRTTMKPDRQLFAENHVSLTHGYEPPSAPRQVRRLCARLAF